MTLAVVLAAGDPAATPPERLVEQWRAAGAREVRVVADPAELSALAATATEPLLISGTDLVAHTAVLRHLATSPVGPTVALVLTDPVHPDRVAVREDRGQVVESATTPVAGATGGFGGALRVGVPDLPALATAARTVPDGPGPAVDRLFAALAATGTTVFAHRVRLLVAHRVTDAAGLAAAEAAVAAVEEDRAELKLSVKERDDFFTTFFVSTWSPYVTKFCARIGLGPTGVTAVSVLFAFAAAWLFAYGDARVPWVVGAVLLYLGFMLDCVDGQLARYTRHFSAWGGWLDTMADRAKEYVVYAGLGAGATLGGYEYGWALAIAAITLQTVRHMTDTWYGALHDEAARRPAPAATGGLGAKLSQASNRVQADTGSVSYWLKRTVVFPIGERWALISLTVALFDPWVSLVAVLAWGVLAFGYTLALRTLRARSMRVPVLTTVDAVLYRDDGPLVRRLGWAARPLPLAVLAALAAAGLLGAALAGLDGGAFKLAVAGAALVVLAAGLGSARPHAGALDWLVPAALRAAEYLFVIAVGVGAAVSPPLVFGLLLVLALHHYDLTARLEKRQAAPPLHDGMLGWDGRLLVLAAAAIAGFASVVLPTLAGYLLVVLLASVTLAWVTVPARASRPAAGTARGATGGR
ncbi:DUF5941 domain-containing protein [Micromonospora echinofusca]|uniref:CDP-alcohol phosphatidyltransferase family protein n=1 Tax=Micromonospora echinofusca TaxID=47858 RepID=A0ABS3VXB1_MICEH|nr:DUF5941 domain-containing protein [Micromonospora echinofusca]MBO4209145.1 CDP-alcohol phosphatidyltransferase family protein [Micromonospora echinofusca]